ncbi:hypothetical protein BV20DRAFT_1021921 [Pilatotrama ljubarskyi]|nr:hypothetical protein BV20DRAFT_1021921 [Pilatotrama ljubarskyi]
MEYLSEEHAKLLLVKEWLVKVDNDTSIPYLFKFYASTVDLKCHILITETKNVWGEVLSSNQIARRWRDCNPQHHAELSSQDEEESWRANCLEYLTTIHSLGGIADLAFEVVKSNYSDLAFELRNDTFRWRWETFNVGPKMSADILSEHLIMPLISATHLSFFSADPVSGLSAADVEKSADRVGRIARRAVDNHVRNTLSKPLIATTLRRMGALLNFVPDPPRIVADVDAPDLTPPSPPAPSRAAPEPPLRRPASPSSKLQNILAKGGDRKKAPAARAPPQPPQDDDSVTEEEPDDEESFVPRYKGRKVAKDHRRTKERSSSPARSVPSKRVTPDHPTSPPSREGPNHSDRGSPSPPARPRTKRRVAAEPSSDEESVDGEKDGVAQVKSGVRRGVKQPIKRGGKRF